MSGHITVEALRASQRARPDAGSVAQALAALLWIAQAALLAWAVDRLAAGGGLGAVFAPAAGVAAVGVLRSLAEAWGLRRVLDAARTQLSALRDGVVSALAARSPFDKGRPASGLAASVVAEQAESVMPWLSRYQPVRLRVLVVPLAIALAVGAFSWLAALVLVVCAPLIPLFMVIIGWRARAASEAHLAEAGSMSGFLLDRLRGLPTLRALGAVDRTAVRVREVGEDLRRRTMAVLRIAFLSSAVLEFFSALGVAMVAVYVGFHLLGDLQWGAWGRRLTLGQGLFILMLAPAFFEPLRDLSAVWHDRAAGEAALDAIDALAREGMPLPAGRAPAALRVPTGAWDVRADSLTLVAGGSAPLLEDFSLHVRPGERIALVGPSGTGKTALLALLAGLVAPTAGRIRLAGRTLDGDSAAALREGMGWMGQRPHVFAGSIGANVALGRAGVSARDVSSALATAALDGVAQAQAAASVGEGGQGLSGGEGVRLALARLAAAASRCGLLLVDEPTAHLDTATAREVTDALLALAQGRTLIVATHDPRVVARMDRVVPIDAPPLREAA